MTHQPGVYVPLRALFLVIDKMTAMRTFLAHLSRRLTCELIVYQWSGVRPFTFSNIFSSKTAWPIKAKFYVEPPWVGGKKVYSRHLSHMTKMAATSIYGKNPSKLHEIWYVAFGTPAHQSLFK